MLVPVCVCLHLLVSVLCNVVQIFVKNVSEEPKRDQKTSYKPWRECGGGALGPENENIGGNSLIPRMLQKVNAKNRLNGSDMHQFSILFWIFGFLIRKYTDLGHGPSNWDQPELLRQLVDCQWKPLLVEGGDALLRDHDGLYRLVVLRE